MGLCGECLRGRLMEYRDKVEQEFSWKSKELWFSNPFFFAIRCHRHLISETIINDIKLMKHSCFLFTPPAFFMFLIHPAPYLHVSYSPFPPSSCFLFTLPPFFMFLIHPSLVLESLNQTRNDKAGLESVYLATMPIDIYMICMYFFKYTHLPDTIVNNMNWSK